MVKTKTLILAFFLTTGVVFCFLPFRANAASCEAFVTKWAWFIGGEVTVNPDGTFIQQSGNAGTWECTDPARGRITMRWRDGGFINSLVVSPDGQNITSTDLSQSYVTARRSGPAPGTPVVRQEDCCQETFGCETKKIEAEFAQKMAKCHFPGNSGCIAEATSTKASQLKAANEKLRLCNRMPGSEGTSSGLQAGAAPLPPPANNDEFHSTEGTSGLAQGCQPCGFDDPPTTSDRTIGQTEMPPEPEPKPRVLKGKPDPNDPKLKWKKTFGLDPDKWVTLPEWMPVLEGGEQQIKNLFLTKRDGKVLGFPPSFHDAWGNLWQLDRGTVKWEYIRGNIQQGAAIGQYRETKSGQWALKNGLWLNPSPSSE